MMHDTVARDILAQLTALVRQQARIADALEAANASDPLLMIQQSLAGDEAVTAPHDASSDDDVALAAYVAALR